MSAGKLPEGWVESQLSEICSKPQYGYTTKSSASGEIKYLRTTDITKGAVNWSNVPYCLDIPDDVSKYQLHDRDIVISRAGSIGFSSLLKNPPSNAVFASYLIRFKPSDFFSELYLKRFLESGNYWNQLSSMSAGNAVQNVNAQKLSTLIVPIPPLVEQIIIAEKLDTLLAQVDSTKARLEQIPQILKRFRQALMAAAVSGHLTEAWRNKHCNIDINNISVSKYKPNNGLFEQAKSSVPEIPSSWQIIPSAHLIEYITSGSRGWADYYSTEGALFLRMSNVRYNTTKLDLDDLQFVNLPGSVEGKRSHVKVDDLIISLTADVGRVARIDKDLGEAYINQHLALVRPTKNIDSEYFALCIASQNIGVKQIQFFKKGATKAGLGLDDIRSLAIPFPPLSEQQEIVRRVEQLFVYADTIEKQVNNALTRVNNLTQSILAKAFRGELSSQWRAENPELITGENSAAALLKKIKDEREAIKRLPKPKRSAIKKKTGKRMSKQIIKVVEALTQAGEPLSGQQLLDAAGYPGDSNTDDLEKFFLDIRQALIVEKSIVKLERSEDGQDWFSLAEVGSNE
ncbi:type I restriction enzyme, S subunit [Enterobacter sp. kpr-6]|uniref:restriction endonuclease subunit S n=1 Tax=Enterobacter sp. kpr-6 TaxID=1761782 RepID=UPI0008E32270|nr:restriction endonuclease subunit S [Enterobacter sp. kpr-6]SFR09031.1 type I restriction enzyme, S subunit [Enterobacter sp. kpr-6]